jgi:hypothetical protein
VSAGIFRPAPGVRPQDSRFTGTPILDADFPV